MADETIVPTDGDAKKLQDLVATTYLGYANYKNATAVEKEAIRSWMQSFYNVAGDVNQVLDLIEKGDFDINSNQARVLNDLLAHREILDQFTREYIAVIDLGSDAMYSLESETQGSTLVYLLGKYEKYLASKQTESTTAQDSYDYILKQLNLMVVDPITGGVGDNQHVIYGPRFVPTFDHIDSNKAIRDMLLRDGGKFREDTLPASISPLQCRIGGSTFFVPPTSISVHQAFKAGSMTGGVLRQPNSPKMNLGHSETEINITLYFPNHETIWGFAGNTADFDIFNWDPQPTVRTDRQNVSGQQEIPADKVVPDYIIDRYLSSLRGLVTQFKYAPFLPVKNEYLNRTYGITAVTMAGMTVTTVPDFPFVLAVNLQMNKFNYKPFLPMIDDFDQAIHWGKFRQYMGRAAARLDAKVNQGFLVEKKTVSTGDKPADNSQTVATKFEGDLLPKFNKVSDIANGKNFDFYYPITTPGRIFAPDTTDFRQPGEDQVLTEPVFSGILSEIGLDVVEPPQFDFFEYDRVYRAAKFKSERKILFEWLAAENLSWQLMNATKMNEFIEAQIRQGGLDAPVPVEAQAAVRKAFKDNWFQVVYALVIEDNAGFKALENSRNFQNSNYTIKEWKVPMEHLSMDWSNCIVNNVAVTLSNNFATQQVQLQDDPTYQHIGGGDSRIDVSMTVIGEDNLIRFRRLFEHISGLARLEKVHGVLGFLGIKNVITSLCGVKYVIPLDFEVDTIPKYPHVYNVSMSFIDFDIMQQERENLSSSQQKSLIDAFGKRNPFLRLKQQWSMFNAYPDFPLDLRDEDGTVLAHLDADWYFRSFITSESDDKLFSWGFDDTIIDLVKNIAELNVQLDTTSGNTLDKEDRLIYAQLLDSYTEQLRVLVEEQGSNLPTNSQWAIKDGKLTAIDLRAAEAGLDQNMPEPEMIQHLGFYDKEQIKSSIIGFFNGGYFALGEQDVKTGKYTWRTGMNVFREDLASTNLKGVPSIEGTVPISKYQNEYIDGSSNPNKQYEAIMRDYNYRNLRGRMIKAFPTYMLWLIDEGGNFAGVKLFDNFYGLNSVIDYSVLLSEDSMEDTLVLRLSNIYNKLTTPYKDQIITEDDPLYDTVTGQWITTIENRQRNIESGLTDKLVEIGSVRLKPGVRIHLRMGYGANPNSLQTVFNGVIAEVQPGDIMTIIAQSDAVEFSGMVNTVNQKGSSGNIDGNATGFWLSEPRDLMVRLLTMGSSNFKEWLSWGSKGVLFSDSRFGIRHFGNILYEPMSNTEVEGVAHVQGAAAFAINNKLKRDGSDAFQGILGDYAKDLADITSITSLPSALNGNLIEIGKMLWLNQFSKRDYEIFKRNIYPGNGSGIAQFMGGDQIDAGVTIATATAFYDKSSGVSGSYSTTEDDGRHYAYGSPTDVSDAIASAKAGLSPEINDGDKKTALQGLWDQYRKNNSQDNTALTDDEITSIFADTSTTAVGSTFIRPVKEEGFISEILGFGGDVLSSAGGAIVDTLQSTDSILQEILPGGGYTASALELFTGVGAPLFLSRYSGLISGAGRLAMGALNGVNDGGLGHILGLNSGIPDDDLEGFDEVSFRAQTYMKSVWDLFQLCAALLPNYIVAVRPFEDRSTVFYGKPHWLYTSGVIPVSTGVPKDLSSKPSLDSPDSALAQILEQAKASASTKLGDMMAVVDKSGALKNIMSFNGTDVDPYNVAGDVAKLSSQEDVNNIISLITEKVEDQTEKSTLIAYLQSVDVSFLSPEQLDTIFVRDPVLSAQMTDHDIDNDTKYNFPYKKDSESQSQYTTRIKTYLNNKVIKAKQSLANNITKSQSDQLDLLNQFSSGTGYLAFMDKTVASNGDQASKDKAFKTAFDLYTQDPITFAYNFGWKFDNIPVYFDPESGYGTDKVGSLARSLYNEKADLSVIAATQDRSDAEAREIWATFRKDFRERRDVKEEFIKFYPTYADDYDVLMDTFMRFMWQDPYNRAWVVITTDKIGDGLIDSAKANLGLGDDKDKWDLSKLVSLWKIFLSSGDVKIDSATDIIAAPQARRWMEQNAQPGDDAKGILANVVEDIGNWVDENVGQLIGLISDTITGFISSIRLSLMQMGNAVSQAGDMQRQANILNASLNDSIYYQYGEDGSLLRLVDNPFTREYGEPVIEIREPFQRIHFISSFDQILDNKITENLTNVATVITAVSDGKYPVTVHFDKGISPERQVERVVETGLLWDNAVGSGLFGFLQPLLHPLESLRGYSKAVSGSSDQLSARRVALYHLKEGLKDIYTGEIVIIGDADIRPHDLLYIADVCQPAGTKVKVVVQSGSKHQKSFIKEVNIENLNEGDVVLSYDPKGRLRKRGSLVSGVTKTPWFGDLVNISTEATFNQYTPDHHCVVKFGDVFANKYLIYLMKKNNSYRIGIIKGQLTTQHNRFGPVYRAIQENADAVWIIDTADTKSEASFKEDILSYKYGIPQNVFIAGTNSRAQRDQTDIDAFWMLMGDLTINAERLLLKNGQSSESPIWKLEDNKIFMTTRPTVINACNIMDGMQVVVVNDDNNNFVWEVVKTSRQRFEGYVYSMTVDGDHTYIGNDVVTHNCERMYGMVEVEKVVHHFTPDTGFITAITPNAIVTINDPARWSLLSYMWSKMTTYNMRDDFRAYMNVKTDRTLASASQEIDSTDIYKYFSTQINGSVQHTQGSTALIRDLGAVYTGGGIKALTAKDKAIDQIAKVDLALGVIKNGGAVAGAVLGAAAGGLQGAVIGGAAGWAVSDLLWQGWQWVKENLLDQHGCYIQYLNKDGMPMDAGLSYASGVAVGTNHTVNLFPSAMGVSGRFNTKEDGHYRITINDILGSLGYSEVETLSLYRDTSMFVNQINTQILALTGRDPVFTPSDNFMAFSARLLSQNGEAVDPQGTRFKRGVEDGDTLNIRVTDQGTSTYPVGTYLSIRLSYVNAYEIQYHDDDYTSYNESDLNPSNDMGKLAQDYLIARFSSDANRNVAIRVDKRNEKSYERTIGAVFHNVPLGTTNRTATLLEYAKRNPAIPFDSYLSDGRPYTLNWEMVMTGYGQVDMRESLWNTTWRNDALTQNTSDGSF